MPKKGSTFNSISETYTVLGNIGGGGSGVVDRVKDTQQNELAAKILKPGFSKQKLKRFENEMMFCWKEDHPHLIKVLDFGLTQDGEPFYVMPLAISTLRSLMKRGIDKVDVLPLFSQMLDGVEAAHLKGVTHRDLKPENVLIETASAIKIADFGIAHFEEDALHTAVETTPHERLASWEYAAPEQRRLGQTVDLRADIYSLGLMLNELFALQVAHGADPTTIASVAPEYAYLDDIANAMRQNSADRRPGSIAEVKNLLIARGNEFVQQQKLDALRQTVIPASQVSDPLIDDPIHLIGVVYRNGNLIFTISRSPNGRWLQRFHNMGSFASVMGSGPEYFQFSENTATVPAKEQTAQMVVNHFKNYLQTTNELYARDIREQTIREEAQKRQALQEAIQRETKEREVNQRINANLTW